MSQDILNVVSPDGDLGSMTPQVFAQAKAAGFRLAAPEEVQAHFDREDYGQGMGNALKAFGEEAAGSATFGLSRELENATGLTTPAAQAARAKYNPVANTLGTVAGIAAPLLIAPEAAPNLVGQVAKLGSKTTAAAEGLIGAGEHAGVVHKILSTGAAQGLGSAVEGAAYGLGQSVTEHALGDPDLNAEKVLSNVGFGAALGGALGAGFKVGEIGVPKTLTKAKAALSATGEKLGDLTRDAFAETSGFISGKPVDAIKKAIDGRAELVGSEELRQKTATEFAGTLQEHVDTLNEVSRTANGKIRPEEMLNTLKGMPVETARFNVESIQEHLAGTIVDMEAHPALYPTSAVAKMQGLSAEFDAALGKAESAGHVYQAVNDLKKNIDKQGKIFGRAISPEYADAAERIKGIRGALKENLQNEDLWGEAAARQTAYNDAQSELLFHSGKSSDFQKAFLVKVPTRSGGFKYEVSPQKVQTFFSQIADSRGAQKAEALQKFIDSSNKYVDQVQKTYEAVPSKSFDRAAVDRVISKNSEVTKNAMEQAELQKTLGMLGGGGHNAYLGEGAALGIGYFHPAVGAAIEGFNLARNPGLAIQRLAKLEKMAKQTSDVVQRLSQGIFKTSTGTGKAVAGAIGGKATKAFESSPKAASTQDHREEMIAKLQAMPTDAEGQVDQLAQATSGINQHAPKTARGVQTGLTRGSLFLHSKIPQLAPKAVFGKAPKYSQSELTTFGRYLSAVETPTSVLGQVKDGTITPESMEALTQVYPKLYAEMTQSVMEHLNEHTVKGGEVPFKTRMGLSLFLNQDLDQALAQSQIMSNQVAILKDGAEQAQEQAQGRAARPSQTGLGKLTGSTGLLTAAQASARRVEQG